VAAPVGNGALLQAPTIALPCQVMSTGVLEARLREEQLKCAAALREIERLEALLASETLLRQSESARADVAENALRRATECNTDVLQLHNQPPPNVDQVYFLATGLSPSNPDDITWGGEHAHSPESKTNSATGLRVRGVELCCAQHMDPANDFLLPQSKVSSSSHIGAGPVADDESDYSD
jgi:hypothetical protein